MQGRPSARGGTEAGPDTGSRWESGNPGGRPKALGEVQELARQHTPSAILELARLALKAKSETEQSADVALGRATYPICAAANELTN